MKRIILFRHGHAEDAFAAGISDHQRALTAKGQKRTIESAHILKGKQTEINLWLTSPLLRAVQTMERIVQVYKADDSQCQYMESLAFGDPREIFAELNDYEERIICLTGHQPTLGDMVAELMFQNRFYQFTMKKSGWAVLDFEDRIAYGEGWLQGFFLPPDELFWREESL
jgi:phosphohistidine phosphatase SixA